MARVICAVGQQAEQPYRLEKIERNVYSIEELCYLLVQSAEILDDSLLNQELIDWIASECALPHLAESLQKYLGKQRLLSDFVAAILQYVGFVPEEKEEKTRQIVSSGQGLEPFEKRLAHAGTLRENASPYEALEEYRKLLEDLPSPERRLRIRALREMGRIYAEQFRFRAAAESFDKAYQLTGRSEIYLEYLACIRLGLSDSEYLAFVAEHPESGQASLLLEKRMDQLDAAFNVSERKLALDSLRQYQSGGQSTSYEVALHQTIQRLKEEFRAISSAGT